MGITAISWPIRGRRQRREIASVSGQIRKRALYVYKVVFWVQVEISAKAKSNYSISINNQLNGAQQAQSRQNQNLVVARQKTTFPTSRNSPSNRRNFGSTSSLNDILPSYNPGHNDYYDDPCIIPELNSGSLSDTEITLRLEPHPEDISDMSADLNESFQKLRTDTNRNNGSDDVTIISKDTEKHEDMKKVIQDIESQLTPPDQNIHMNEIYMTDQYFGTDQVRLSKIFHFIKIWYRELLSPKDISTKIKTNLFRRFSITNGNFKMGTLFFYFRRFF